MIEILKSDLFAVIISFILVLSVSVYFYEKRIKRINESYLKLHEQAKEIIENYNIMLDIMRERLSDDEINIKFHVRKHFGKNKDKDKKD